MRFSTNSFLIFSGVPLRKKLLLNSLSGTSLYLINIVVAFIMSPVIIRALGNRDYGLWELVMSVIGYMGLLGSRHWSSVG